LPADPLRHRRPLGGAPGASPCGRTNLRIHGWLGCADQATKVRGLFVRPEQVAEILRAHPGVRRARFVVALAGERDAMALRAEAASTDPGLTESRARELRSVTKLRGAVERCPPARCPTTAR
jgi:phenylacetate-CoA ligase